MNLMRERERSMLPVLSGIDRYTIFELHPCIARKSKHEHLFSMLIHITSNYVRLWSDIYCCAMLCLVIHQAIIDSTRSRATCS